MNLGLLKLVTILSVTLGVNTALASAAVESCKNDSYTSERITENTKANERIEILNSKKEIVGAFAFEPSSGDIHTLYLCGANSGTYYVEGNAYEGSVSSIYNDEYDSEVDSEKKGNLVKVTLSHVTFSGESEDADYAPFSTVFFFKALAR
jgi:hypothetical protein